MRRLVRLVLYSLILPFSLTGCFNYPLAVEHQPLDPALIGSWRNDKNEKVDVKAVGDHYEVYTFDKNGQKSAHAFEGHALRENGQNLLQFFDPQEKYDLRYVIFRYKIDGDSVALQEPNTDKYFDGKSFLNQAVFRVYFLEKSLEEDFWERDSQIFRKSPRVVTVIPATQAIRVKSNRTETRAQTRSDLLRKLESRVTDEGPFDRSIYQRLKLALRRADPSQKTDEELLATAEDFSDGKLRASVFVAYLKEALAGQNMDDYSVTSEVQSSEADLGGQQNNGNSSQALSGENPFDKFRQTLKQTDSSQSVGKQEFVVPNKPEPKATAEDPFDKFREASPKSKGRAKDTVTLPIESGQISLYCAGNINRYTGNQVVKTEAFEFRTQVNIREQKHKVLNVLRGPMFSSGGIYDITGPQNDVIDLSVESTSPQWKLPNVRYDRLAGKLTGSGKVDMSEMRSRLFQRLRQSGLNMPEGSRLESEGFDSHRRIEVDGSCTPY